MPRYLAFLRGITPLNASMLELKVCFELAGFTNVRTVLATGNIAFDSRSASGAVLERKAEAAMLAKLDRSFYTIVRPVSRLRELLASDPYAAYDVAPEAKRIVSFLREPIAPKVPLPLEADAARVLALVGCEVFTAYLPSPKGPVFMKLIEKAFGKEVTTRTWDTVVKCAAA